MYAGGDYLEFLGSYFEYNGKSSRAYSLVFANVDTEQFLSLNGDIQQNVVFNKQDKRNYFIGESFADSPIQFKAEIVTDDGRVIDRFARREIEKWLFHRPAYCRLYTDMWCDSYGEAIDIVNGKSKRLYLNCRFTNPEKIEGNGGLVGYRFTVECDSSMAWQDAISYEFTTGHTGSSSNSIITIDVDTDLKDYIYPKVTITMGKAGGDITISNNTDNTSRLTSFSGLTANITFTMNGNGINYISGDNYLKFSNKNFIRLLDGENKLSVTGDVSKITFEFQQRRYL